MLKLKQRELVQRQPWTNESEELLSLLFVAGMARKLSNAQCRGIGDKVPVQNDQTSIHATRVGAVENVISRIYIGIVLRHTLNILPAFNRDNFKPLIGMRDACNGQRARHFERYR